MLDNVEAAIAAMAAGQPVLVIDDEARQDTADLIFAASLATRQTVAFAVRHTSGFLCVALTEAEADRLGLPPMTAVNHDRFGTAYAVTVDARTGVTTGISAADRARTIALLSDSATGPLDLVRPGHVVPLRARAGGVLERAGHTEAAVDLALLAGLPPAAALGAVVSHRDPTQMAGSAEIREFADRYGLVAISIADLIAHRRRTERTVIGKASARIPTALGEFEAFAYTLAGDEREHVAIVAGDVADGTETPVYVHSECVAADVFGSHGCDCRMWLDDALKEITRLRNGVVIYLRPTNQIAGSAITAPRPHQTRGTRDYAACAQILTDLGVDTIRMLSNQPENWAEWKRHGVSIAGQLQLPRKQILGLAAGTYEASA
ncbi:3,4-dihydroxy-2-butanone-4-phosphate synthase [Mycolicibacterium litorale]|uniref:3,4-dihydroxy-2-butanone-4-phosphate synthase n=1 Tax=Mycolicibacterium litorale TaxID=758802 RepID=UPI003CF1B85E